MLDPKATSRQVGDKKMRQIGIWRVADQGLKRLQPSNIDFEKDLEDWIEQDPELLEQGLEIVGRQLHVEGGYLDLLGINPQGQWVVIELKGQDTDRNALTQALDYASCIATMPWDELQHKLDGYLEKKDSSIEELIGAQGLDGEQGEIRDVIIYVVGTGSSPGLNRMVDYLSGVHDLPITLVSYQVFQIDGGHKVLVRELTEPEETVREVSKARSAEEIRSQADENGIGDEFQMILEAATRNGLYPRTYRACIMYTSPSNRSRMLFTVRNWTQSDGLLQLYFSPTAFAEFYPVSEEMMRSLFGEDEWRHMTMEEVETFIAKLDHLFEEIGKAKDAE
jgi:hypothetical protein